MKALHIILQLVIIGVGGIVLAALIFQPAPDFMAIVFFITFVAFLFTLTLILKEHTEQRLVPGYKFSFKPTGVFLLLFGIFCIFLGVNHLLGYQPEPRGTSCLAICWLTLLASALFGETAAKLVAFGLWSSVGLFFCFGGYKILKTT